MSGRPQAFGLPPRPPENAVTDHIPPEAVTAAAWLVIADVVLVSAFAAAYAARIVRRWIKTDA